MPARIAEDAQVSTVNQVLERAVVQSGSGRDGRCGKHRAAKSARQQTGGDDGRAQRARRNQRTRDVFITLEIRQAGGHDPVAERLAAVPEVLESHTITGAGDLLCRVVARSNADLQRVLDSIVSTNGVVRSATLISLATQVPYRTLPLVRSCAHGSAG